MISTIELSCLGYFGWLIQAIILFHFHPANLQGKTACNQKEVNFLL
jgi:hypothetical protein